MTLSNTFRELDPDKFKPGYPFSVRYKMQEFKYKLVSLKYQDGNYRVSIGSKQPGHPGTLFLQFTQGGFRYAYIQGKLLNPQTQEMICYRQ